MYISPTLSRLIVTVLIFPSVLRDWKYPYHFLPMRIFPRVSSSFHPACFSVNDLYLRTFLNFGGEHFFLRFRLLQKRLYAQSILSVMSWTAWEPISQIYANRCVSSASLNVFWASIYQNICRITCSTFYAMQYSGYSTKPCFFVISSHNFFRITHHQ